MTCDEFTSMFGESCSDENFASIYSRAFASFLKGPDVNGTARLHSCYLSDIAETVIFEVDVELPQHPMEDIRERESIACRFSKQNDSHPEILALREDFPRLPHQNLRPTKTPKSLCLNSTDWSEAKHRWSPSSLLESIRGWLVRATTAQLHSPGQPREPLLARPAGYLILPSGFDVTATEKLEISGDPESSPMILWAQRAGAEAKPGRGKFRLISFETPTREHGLIEHLPGNLLDLEVLCRKVGFDLRQALIDTLKHRATAGKIETSELSFTLLLVLHNTVTGQESPEIVTREEWGFMLGDGISLAEALGIGVQANGLYAPSVVPISPSDALIKGIQVLPIAIFRKLDTRSALAASGIQNPYPPVAVIGAGALGSKSLEILARQGLADAVIIDKDRFFPHNTARHVLVENAVGHHKALALAHFLSILHDQLEHNDSGGFTSLEEDFRDTVSDDMNFAFAKARYLLDFSASVSVSRGLSARNDIPRCLSAFLTPGGDTFFIHNEDADRRVRLDWLEAITLRSIVENTELHNAYRRSGSQIWYGGPCREVSTILPSQNVSLFAAACAGVFSNCHTSPSARCIGYTLNMETMALKAVEIETTEPIVTVASGWTIKYDLKLVDQMRSMSEAAIPNETGGVLLGILDREKMNCSIVLASSSPPDSMVWPNAYIRGVNGLKKFVSEVSDLTAGQLHYVGEWHSHPKGCSSNPSETDKEALRILKGVMGREGLPAIAFILGAEPQPHISVGW
jgi:hypothetical protein